MPDKLSFSRTFQALEHAINISQQRHSLISSNISNVDTPGYKAKDADFHDALTRALDCGQELDLARTNPNHIGSAMNAASGVEVVEEKSEWNGFNWVNIDKEMTRLTENNLMYRTSVETLLRKIALLKEVIREGGR
jgi:flagellar basal-body rod protein FlgB